MRSGYAISKGYDITQTKGRPLEERPQRDIHTLLEAVLKNQNIRLQIADNLPDKIQAQYIPNQRTMRRSSLVRTRTSSRSLTERAERLTKRSRAIPSTITIM